MRFKSEEGSGCQRQWAMDQARNLSFREAECTMHTRHPWSNGDAFLRLRPLLPPMLVMIKANGDAKNDDPV